MPNGESFEPDADRFMVSRIASFTNNWWNPKEQVHLRDIFHFRAGVRPLPGVKYQNTLKTRQMHGISPRLIILFSVALILLGDVGEAQKPAASTRPDDTKMFGRFDPAKDIFFPQFDGRPDADDVHAQAAIGSMLRHPEFSKVKVYAVHNAYGKQKGVIHDSRTLMAMAFGGAEGPDTWTDANTPETSQRGNPDSKWALSVARLADKAQATLKAGGAVWVMEAGQSDITADWVALLIKRGISDKTIKENVHVVQHSKWNEDQASGGALDYVKLKTSYIKIDDGNSKKNKTPDYQTDKDEVPAHSPMREKAKTAANPNAATRAMWMDADRIIGKWKADYSNIHRGGLDFSDVVEAWWIFQPEDADTIPDFWAKYVITDAK